jgi:hypothetical protein
VRKLRSNDVRRDLTEIRDWMIALLEDVDRICRYANDFMDDGVSGVSYEGHRKGSEHPDLLPKVEARRRDNDAEKAAVKFGKIVEAMRRDARQLSGIAWVLLPMDPKEASILAESDELANDPEQQTRQAQCKNKACGRLVARTVNDRLRGGRCDACRKHFERTGNERLPVEALALDENVIVEGAA